MPKPWTSELIKKALGVQKCNGSLEAATEDLSLEKAMDVARQKNDDGHLTGADLKAVSYTHLTLPTIRTV